MNYVTSQQFEIYFYCDVDYQIYMFNWISSIGDNILSPYFDRITIDGSTQSFIIYNDISMNIIYQINGWDFYSANTKFQIKQQILSSTAIKISSEITYFQDYLRFNYFYTLYKTYNISSISLDTQLDDQPKSVKHFIVQRGFSVDSIDKYRYLNNYRNSTYFKIKQQYNQSMEIYDWLLILASQQCTNSSGPCDFYNQYIINCNMQFQFCADELKNSNYFINYALNYQLCDTNCKTCYQLQYNCTSCQTDYYTLKQDIRLQIGFCSQICDDTCLTCSTTNITLCFSCDQFATLTSNQCICNSGYYFDNIDTKLCQQCSQICQTCKNDDKDYCLSCTSIAILTGTTCYCPIGMYYDQNGDCQQCSSICKTCIDNQSCTSCIDTLQVLDQGQCYCPNNFYIDNTFKCSHCQFPCANCSDQNTCLSCPSDKTLNNQTCICTTSQYLDQNGICQNCHQLCIACDGPQDNQCLSCDSMRQLTQDKYCSCINGYYSLNFECLQCSKKCETCTNNEDYCLSCNSTTILTGTTCLCSIGQYYDQNSDCQQCSTICKTCIDNQSCTSCIDTLQVLDQGQCYCPNSYYIDNTFKCSHCQFPCANCQDQYICLSCPSDKTLDNQTCICATSQQQDQNGTCQNCHQLCTTCNGPQDNQCLSCNSMRLLAQDNTCQCINGYYSLNSDCLKCSKKCETCVNNEEYCLSCNQITILTETTCVCPIGMYYDQNSDCQQCQIICKTCIDNQSCTSCIDTLQEVSQGQCYCPDNYFIDNTFKCSHCQFPCYNCLDQNTCLSCPADKILFNFKCICDSSKYLDQNGYCQACNHLCNTCEGPQENHCLSCSSVRTLSFQNQCQCNQGYYSINDECLKCSYYCQECDQETICLTCPNNRYLDELNTCVCVLGFYNKENQQSCELCPNNCAECINYNSCTKCNIHMTLQNGKCQCSDGYYEQSGSCMSCDSQLGKYFQKSCNYKNCNDNIWTPSEECDDGNKIDNDGCTNCKIDKNFQCFNIIAQVSICYQCESQCSECQYLQKKIVCIYCKDGYYLHNNKCFQCDDNCKTCSSFSKCETCPILNTQPQYDDSCPRCDLGTYLQNDKCVSQCGDGIKTDDELCDDGNTNSADGCSNQCQIEDSYICTINQDISNCFYHEKPQLKLHNVIKITDQQYVIQILSNQEVKYKEMKVQVQQQIQESYNFTYYANYSEKNQSFNILLINVTINFTASFSKEVFQIQVHGDIINKYNQSINQTTIIQEFYNIFILSEFQKETSQRGSEIAVQLFYASIGLSLVQLIIGGSESISVMLRTQNYLEYMRFIKIDFPPNFAMLFTYFANSNILKYLDFSPILKSYFNIEINFNIQSDNHLINSYPIKTSFIANIMPFILTLVQSLGFIILTKLLINFLNTIIVYKHKGKEAFSMKIYKLLSFGQMMALKSIRDFKQNGIRELFLISQYAIFFALFIRLKVFEYQSFFDMTELTLAIVFAYHCRKYMFNYKQSRITVLRLINSIIYIFCIVFLQNQQLEQLLIILIQSIIILVFLLSNKELNIQSIVEEFSFLITFLSSILYIYSPVDIDYIMIGFIQFGMIQFSVVLNMMFQLQSLYSQYKHHQIKKKKAHQIQINRQLDIENRSSLI